MRQRVLGVEFVFDPKNHPTGARGNYDFAPSENPIGHYIRVVEAFDGMDGAVAWWKAHPRQELHGFFPMVALKAYGFAAYKRARALSDKKRKGFRLLCSKPVGQGMKPRLSVETVRAIKAALKERPPSAGKRGSPVYSVIAAEFGTTVYAVHQIAIGRTWKGV